MSADRNTLYPALGQAITNALEAAGDAPCEVCGAQPARPYAFAWARIIPGQAPPLGATEVITYYDSLGAHAVHLCDACVETHRKMLARQAWKATITYSLIILPITVIGTLILVPELVYLTLALMAAVIIFAHLFGARQQFWYLLGNVVRVGQDKALSLHIAALRDGGMDIFWPERLWCTMR